MLGSAFHLLYNVKTLTQEINQSPLYLKWILVLIPNCKPVCIFFPKLITMIKVITLSIDEANQPERLEQIIIL